MLTQLAFALRDIRRNPIVYFFFVVQLLVPIFFVSVTLTFMADSIRYIRRVHQVSDHEVVFFSPSIGAVQQWRFSRDAAALLVEVLDEDRRGYSYIENIALREHPNLNFVVGMGQFGEFFQLGSATREATQPLVLIGHNVNALEIGSPVRFGRSTTPLRVSDRLPPSSSFIARGALKSLDSSVLILAEAEEMMGYFFYDFEYWVEIAKNTCLIDPTGSELRTFVTRMLDESGMALNPLDLGTYAAHHHAGNFYGILYFLVFFGITLAFVVVGIVTNTLQLVDSRMAEYAIHLLSGAKMSHLYSRVVIYLLLLVSLPVIIVSAYVFPLFRVPLYTGLIGVAPLIVCGVALLSSIPLLKLRSTDIVLHLRSDDQ
ncbi:MAG: hypothetical protein KGZ64_06370 [Thermaerobacter sp.]|nr:hypothetical protein [Thermaerobacter sp.]